MININRLMMSLVEYLGTRAFIVRENTHYKLANEDEWHSIEELPFYASLQLPTAEDVNVERDRRLQLPFSFQDRLFDRDEKSLARITGAATLAGFALLAQTETTFQWITSTNEIVTLSALDMFNLGKAAAEREAAIIFAARQLKDMPSIPEDYISDAYWP